MTGGQGKLVLDSQQSTTAGGQHLQKKDFSNREPLRVISASDDELEAHAEILKKMGGDCVWGSSTS